MSTDMAKKMMEKWGWKSGQGLGAKNSGMKSCLMMHKQDGSSSQGRIGQAPRRADLMKQEPKKEDKTMMGQADAANFLQSMGAELGLSVPEDEAPAAKRMKTGGLVDIDPRETQTLALTSANLRPFEESDAPAGGTDSTVSQFPRIPIKRERIRQYVTDDWRWSKGTDCLRFFEEVQLPGQLLTLAKKILGDNSRYPARISDDTDCVAECTAWGTLLVRPRGTGANIELAKRMLYEVLHPHSEDLREDALLTPEEMAEAAMKVDSSVYFDGDDEFSKKMRANHDRSHGKLKSVGLGGEDDAMIEAQEEAGGKKKSDMTEIQLATIEDAALVQVHLKDLRIATGITAVLSGNTLKLYGKDKQTRKAQLLIDTLVDTGEWVSVEGQFMPSQGEKAKRRVDEGPSSQILLKIPEGPATKLIEKHLKSMERASEAEQLKLTSKAVGGKRTLMVEGTRAVHERIKLMVRELSEKGESPMLTKSMNSFAVKQEEEENRPKAFSETISFKPKVSSSSSSTPGVVSAAAQLNITAATADKPAEPKKAAGGVGMRNMPAPKLSVAALGGDHDLFAGLPQPEPEGTGDTEDRVKLLEDAMKQAGVVAEDGAKIGMTEQEMAAAEKLLESVPASDGITE